LSLPMRRLAKKPPAFTGDSAAMTIISFGLAAAVLSVQ
jgi:hypothetical protein